jgi:hypothetical protein
MNKITKMLSIALIATLGIAAIGITVEATQQYLAAYNTIFSTNATCSVCHVNSAGGGTLNSYGMQFQNQTNHVTNPAAALITIGAPNIQPTVEPIYTPTYTGQDRM